MEVQFIPPDQRLRAFTAGMADNNLYLVDTQEGTAKAVFNFDAFDIPDVHAMPLSVLDLGPGSGPHFLRLTSDEKRLVVTDYFLVEDLASGGVVQSEGDHKVHVIDVHESDLELDPDFDLDFNRDIGTGPARPHGVVLLTARDD